MPTGLKSEKRLADVIGNAIKIARIATGEEEDVLAPTPEKQGKDPAAVAMGKKGRRRTGEGDDPGAPSGGR